MNTRSRKVRIALLTAIALGLGALQCQTTDGLQPPPFDYERLAARYIAENPGGHFPVTIQRGSNLQAVSSLTGHMFYTSNVLGSGDIWIRDLGKTVSVALVRHPAEQYKPAVPPTGDRLVFVSEDSDPRGDLRFVTLEAPQIIRNALTACPILISGKTRSI